MKRIKALSIPPITQPRIELRKIESELETYTQIFSLSPDPIIITKPNHKIVYTNSSFKNLLGYDPKTILGKNPRVVLADPHSRKQYRHILVLLKNGESFTSDEIILKKKDTNTMHTHATFFPVVNNKKNTFYVLIFHDITTQVQLTKRIEHLANQNKLILESAGEGIYGIDLDGTITFVNPTAARLLGYSVEEMQGKNVHELVHYKTPEGAPLPVEECEHFTCTLRRGVQFHSSEYVFWKKDGTPLPIEITSSPIHDRGGVVGAVALFNDITERKKTDELKTQFLSMVSHELKTPVTTVMLLSDALLKKTTGSSKIHKSLSTINYELKRLTSLINDLLDISRLDTNKFVIRAEPVKLRSFIKRVVESMQLITPTRSIKMRKLPNVEIIADPHRLEQVFINLINNAIKYSSEDTVITISATIKRKKVTIGIQDQGVGIPKNKIDRIFDKYYQIQHSQGQNGFGLGLFITKEIIQTHRGKIWVESEIGKGSTFYFTLPIIDTD